MIEKIHQHQHRFSIKLFIPLLRWWLTVFSLRSNETTIPFVLQSLEWTLLHILLHLHYWLELKQSGHLLQEILPDYQKSLHKQCKTYAFWHASIHKTTLTFLDHFTIVQLCFLLLSSFRYSLFSSFHLFSSNWYRIHYLQLVSIWSNLLASLHQRTSYLFFYTEELLYRSEIAVH